MKSDIKQQWLDALRSGEYNQGVGQLKSVTGEFCCLGVLCDLHAKATITEWDNRSGRYLGRHGNLPEEVQRWAGLQDEIPVVMDSSGYPTDVSVLNDTGTSFATIADSIEASL